MSCKCVQFRVPPLSLHSFLPFFSLVSSRGQLSPSRLGCSFHAAPPLCPEHRLTRPEEGAPHSPSLLSGCWAGMVGHTLRNRVPSSQSLQHGALCPHSRRSFQSSGQISGQRKTRASPSRENTVISRYFVLPAPTPPPAARDLAQKTNLRRGEHSPGPLKLGSAQKSAFK